MATTFLASRIAFNRRLLEVLAEADDLVEEQTAGRMRPGGRVRLESLGDDVWLQQFRFTRSEINQLVMHLDLPESVRCPDSGAAEDRVTALCMLLRRLAYPIRLVDVELIFGWERSRFSRITRIMALILWHRWKHLLRFDPVRLSPEKLETLAAFVALKGAPLDVVVAFLDGTLRKNARPVRNQRMVFNGWKRIHCLKYHLLLSPDGIAIHVYGPVEGRRHDETVYKESGLANLLRTHFHTRDGRLLFIYGDSGYSCKGQVLSPYKGSVITDEQRMWNNAMSKVREPVEWIFGEVVKQFAFLDFSHNFKLLLQPCGLYYLIAILFCNAHTILHRPQTPQYFHCPPPTLTEYFHGEPVDDEELDAWCMSTPWGECEVPEGVTGDSEDPSQSAQQEME
ncbi:hypothetical protein PLEOSDRAFT_166716 [Pleurotus ostreatus PC15]|uniref:DDE Tnp4 domain-containing protein n=1 Tax=Pleurotus ostreatus (strain PC15) TaxID=1137138 RepID=A0A067NUG4_PLEO1|nr:hypothetical protein PLEOSDRAFT_166716 [Pleurotus ostreatus PC15]